MASGRGGRRMGHVWKWWGGGHPGLGAKMTEAWVQNKPGMASVKEMALVQDGLPPDEFPPVHYGRWIPTSGPSATAIFLTAFGAFAYGMYQVDQGNMVRSALKEEKIAARSAILPMLQEWKKKLGCLPFKRKFGGLIIFHAIHIALGFKVCDTLLGGDPGHRAFTSECRGEAENP